MFKCTATCNHCGKEKVVRFKWDYFNENGDYIASIKYNNEMFIYPANISGSYKLT